jgi:hypothetical protein
MAAQLQRDNSLRHGYIVVYIIVVDIGKDERVDRGRIVE